MKAAGWMVMLMVGLLAGCREREGMSTPEKKQDTPLKEVEKILTGAGAARINPPPVKPGPGPTEDPSMGAGGKGETGQADGGGDSQEVPVASAVPGKPGFVISPYSKKIIDVTGLEVGALVADPHFPAEDKKYFLVPEPAAAPEEDPGEESEPPAGSE